MYLQIVFGIRIHFKLQNEYYLVFIFVPKSLFVPTLFLTSGLVSSVSHVSEENDRRLFGRRSMSPVSPVSPVSDSMEMKLFGRELVDMCEDTG